ncbi:bifunctional 23S rRNA (guanine(2069)-N(7))-methyltransferase RlmK/23S rRNA (guanine(2445)-N(2))-methyltransferase RlmL, partial [Gordonibacter urolithinfaciens]
MQQEKLEFFASCLAGLEAPLADELKALGIRSVRPLGGGVAFFCDVRHALAACLWSRLASRIMLVVGRVDARLADLLFEDALELPWEDVIAPGASIAVSAHGMNDELRNTRFTALKVKDAVCDRLREARGERPNVDAEHPDAAIDVRVREKRATISLDLSGASLYRRTYLAPDDGAEAPLECALAAGLLALAG